MKNTKQRTCCFTGHRPSAFFWGDNRESAGCKQLLFRLEQAIDSAIKRGYRRFIAGNALGVDTWAAEIVLKKKEQHADITLEIAVPFAGHNKRSAEALAVQKSADFVHVVSNAKPYMLAYRERNEYMVNRSSLVIAVYDEYSAKGGTLRTVEYAKKQGVEIFQIAWSDISE